MAKKRTLFELTTGEGEARAHNVRTVAVEDNGDLVLSGTDSDPGLAQFTGSTEWEGVLRVAARDLPRVRKALEVEFGTAEELLDLVVKGFGGRLNGMTQFGEWLRAKGIPTTSSSE